MPRCPRLRWRERAPAIRRLLLDLDSRLDSGTYECLARTVELCRRYACWLERFRLFGWQRVTVGACSEGTSLLAGGLLLLLVLGLPTFQFTSTADLLSKPQLSVVFLDRYGHEIGRRGIRRADPVPLEQYPSYLIQAVLATEDRRFYDHLGIDVLGTLRALTVDLTAGETIQGGSSITQQVAKNLFLSNERTIARKLKEAFLAVWLETKLSKDQILKLYLDRAYMGAGTFGIEAAAQAYFGKSARDVSLAEAAMLAGLFKAPSRLSPAANLPAARARADVVLDNLVDAGFMNEGLVFGARRTPASPIERSDDVVDNGRASPDYYLDWAYKEVKRIAAGLPNSVLDHTLVVRTALDPGTQSAAETTVEMTLSGDGRSARVAQGAAVVMALDGAVRAMVGGRDYGQSQFNRAADALRQPGSSFKPYVYATALVTGMTPASIVEDAPICIGDWCPQNDGRSYRGRITLTQALTHSVNTVAVRLSLIIGHGNARVGRAAIAETARRMGVQTPLADARSLPLGVDEVTVVDQTAAYATFPNLGKAVPPHAVLEIRTSDGRPVWSFDRDGPKPQQAIPPQVAGQMIAMMNKVVEDGTGRRAQLDGIPVAGKTGTTSDNRDAWFVGYTGNFVCGVWFGNDDHRPMDRVTGGSLPAMTWARIMTAAHQRVEAKSLPGLPPPSVAALGGASQKKGAGADRISVGERTASALRRIARSMQQAGQALARSGEPGAPASLAGLEPAGSTRRN